VAEKISTAEEIKSRVMYKAKRSDHTSAATDQKTLQGTSSKEESAEEQTLGRF